ncbi:protein of unknown function [Stenotrophomonas maltophilia]|nr:protein of unknown function [Stenotrophomonas maltophilia]
MHDAECASSSGNQIVKRLSNTGFLIAGKDVGGALEFNLDSAMRETLVG